MAGLHKVLKKCCSIDASQDSEYSSGSEYGRVLNMPSLCKVLNKTVHYCYMNPVRKGVVASSRDYPYWRCKFEME